MIYALVSAGASALASALGASEAGSAAGASAEGSASEEVQRVCSVLVREVASSTFCTYQVVPQELHDQSGVLVALLRKGVELSDGIVESLLGKLASLVGRVEDLVVEDGEVQGETETDGVGKPRGTCRRRSCACRQRRTRQGSGGSHPSYKSNVVSGLSKQMRSMHTSCGRRPWTRRSQQRG
jgi:hypothetical protein